MSESFLDRLNNRPAAPATQPVNPAAIIPAGQNATAYAAAALKGEVENILAVPIGSGRNDQLNRSAVKMYGLVAAGAIDEHTVTQTLGAADGGLDYPATRRTLQSARDAVFNRLGARVIPDRKELAPWEQSDDPFSDHYVPPSPSTAVSDDGSNGPSSRSTEAARHASTDTTNGSHSAAGTADAADGGSGDADAAHKALVALAAGQERIRREARRLVDVEDAARTFVIPEYTDTLTAELAIPDEPVTYLVDQLIPTGANVLLAAQFKAGKTTLISNLARSVVDRIPFLGRYDVADIDGRVGIFNYEVSRSQYRRWLRDIGIENTDRVSVLPLRGLRLPLLVPHVEDWVVDYLREHDVSVWIVDPFARASSGVDENSNPEVGVFLETLDVIKERAGVSELIIPTHTGRAEQEQGDERARGATRLDDWADVRWLLVKDRDERRYFRATGRDVDTDEEALEYDTATRLLKLTGGDRRSNRAADTDAAVLSCVEARPGIGVRDLREAVRQILGRADTNGVTKSVDRLVAQRRIHVLGSNPKRHMPGPRPASATDPPDDPFSMC